MSDEKNPWYQIGYAVERTRHPLRASAGPLSALETLKNRLTLAASEAGVLEERPERETRKGRKLTVPKKGAKNGKGKREAEVWDEGFLSKDALVVAGAATLGAELLKHWPGSHKLGLLDYVRGGAAGAAAALAVEVLRPLLSGQDSAEPVEVSDRALAGVGLGLVYAAAVEPRLPGTPWLRGALMGAAAYLLAPLGGITRVLRPLSPHRKIPVLSGLLEPDDADDKTFLEAVTLGVILGMLYESGDSSGMAFDDE